MQYSQKYIRPFLGAMNDEQRHVFQDLELLGARLDQILSEARARWPRLAVSDEQFLASLAERVVLAEDPPDALERVHGADLLLACACASGNEDAIGCFRSRYLDCLSADLASFRIGAAELDDLQQNLQQRLFVGEDKHPPRIVQYTGSGSLRSWVRVATTRAAIDMLRKAGRECLTEENNRIGLEVAREDPELQHLKGLYRQEFKQAFQEAFATLDDKERNLLRHQLLDGLSMEEIGSLYRVHQTTVSRWMSAIRDKLHARTRKAMFDRHPGCREEFQSIVRLVQSQLDVSMQRLMEDESQRAQER